MMNPTAESRYYPRESAPGTPKSDPGLDIQILNHRRKSQMQKALALEALNLSDRKPLRIVAKLHGQLVPAAQGHTPE